MLIKKVLKKDKGQNGLCLSVMKMFFSKMPYFREMGAKLNITVKFEIWEDSEVKWLTYNLGW